MAWRCCRVALLIQVPVHTAHLPVTASVSNAIDVIKDGGLLAIMRAQGSDDLLKAADVIAGEGINALEISLTTPGALDVIRQARDRFGVGTVFGAGTVLDVQSAEAAINHGADFIVAPILDLETLQLCKEQGVPYVPGALTPTEMHRAWHAGARLVKLFPASLGGPSYVKAILAPLTEVQMMAVGGVDATNLNDYLKAGAVAAGVGSSLVNQQVLSDGDFGTMRRRARRLRGAVEEARS